MNTRKLFYEDPHMTEFDATVTGCEADAKEGFWISLDQTAFYPEGGGQPTDLGVLAGQPVSFVKERDGLILHHVPAAFEIGTAVHGTVDAERRTDLMTQHSGEHIFSGLICRTFGCDNVGFHISDDFVTIDFNTQVTFEDLLPIEEEANRLVRANLPVHIFYPSPEELAVLEYRSKKELTGLVRIVEFPEADICACCGTHVLLTGEIGLIKLVSCQSHRGGVRLEIACGKRALDYVRTVCAENKKVSVALSAKETETGAAVKRALKELLQQKERCAAMETGWIAGKAAELSGKGPVLLLEENLSVDSTRRLCNEVLKVCGGFCGVLSDCGEDGVRYCFGETGGNLKELTAAVNAAFGGRGGGKPEFTQGTLRGSVKEIAEKVRSFYPEA